MPPTSTDILQTLPGTLAATVRSHLEKTGLSSDTPPVGALLEDLAWAFSQESAFGHAVAGGITRLAGSVPDAALDEYHRRVRAAGAVGPTMGWAVATFLAPVLAVREPELLHAFGKALRVMAQKGTYLLSPTLRALEGLLDRGESSASAAYLDLLSTAFSGDLLYNRCQHLSRILPAAVSGLDPKRRLEHIRLLHRVVSFDVRLVEAFVAGMDRGLRSLPPQRLERFVDEALSRTGERFDTGEAFLSVRSGEARSILNQWRTAVPLSEVRPLLSRYLGARLGRPVQVRPLSALTRDRARKAGFPRYVCSGGRTVYLAEEIAVFDSGRRNRDLYKCLAKLEGLYHEFGTFFFDLERFQDRYPGRPGPPLPPGATEAGDLRAFWDGSTHPGRSECLFCIFEHGRLHRNMAQSYPGLARTALVLLREEWGRNAPNEPLGRLLHVLYGRIALGMPPDRTPILDSSLRHRADRIADRWRARTGPDAAVEDTAWLTAWADSVLEDMPPPKASPGWTPPFDRRILPEIFHEAHRPYFARADRMARELSAQGKTVYRSDLAEALIAGAGDMAEEDLRHFLETHPPSATAADPPAARKAGTRRPKTDDPVGASILWYPEWDYRMADHLQEHVRLVSRKPSETEDDFYPSALERSAPLVRRVRKAFEMLRPEGLVRLRPWVEGDEFDHRSLMDFVVDRRAGHPPPERLYTKKVKERRDVAATLLIDLSRSTASRLRGSSDTVLDVEKEAVVLFCEAMAVVGDRFSVAGFSGTGRLAVDYWEIKDFDEGLDPDVRGRIGALRPQRNTRMGAAVRHAAARFRGCDARMRLLIVLSDGFPNDSGYKRRYAVEDTRAAILEARAQGTHTHAITVQHQPSPRLDDVYGPLHHTLIADVRELPDRLLRLYGKLTR